MKHIIAFLLVSVPLFAAEHQYVGLTQKGGRIEASIVAGPSAASPTVLLVGGLAGNDATSRVVAQEVATFEAIPQNRRPFQLLAIPSANPDGAPVQFPPAGVAYRENKESHYLWRWIGIHAPDLVLIAGTDDFGLADALSQNAAARVARIPARRVSAAAGILVAIAKETIAPSDARKEIERRRSRTPRQFAEELAKIYGHDLNQVTYIQSLALIARLRLGETADVIRLAEPYASGSRDGLARPNSLALAGHMLFAELAERTGDARYKQLALKAASYGFTETGEMREAVPFHGEMSDSIFMDFSTLTRAGKLTGENKYFDMALRHLAFMRKHVERPDGLFRHSPLNDAAWGRGNAFSAFGFTFGLGDFPKDHPAYKGLLQSYQAFMSKLAKLQDEDGLWRQVLDHPGSYPEFSSTAMFGFAMLRGIRNGWLEGATYQPVVDKAWRAILTRSGPDGVFMDISESTNKQPNYDDYLHRAAILDKDPRAGAMALMFATEMAGLK
jgi:unsaturated rhamnogalacturonyl hydrolase